MFRSWRSNIGNGFIDIGLEWIIKECCPHAEVIRVGTPRILPSVLEGTSWRTFLPRKLLPQSIREVLRRRLIMEAKIPFEYAQYIGNIDIVFVGGNIFTGYIDIFIPLLLRLKEKGSKIVLCGVGGDTYSSIEQKESRAFLAKLKPDIFISRDLISYQLYSNFGKYSWNGIDCAYFVSEAYQSIKIKKNYIVANFDNIKEPNIPNPENLPIVRTHHTYFIKREWVKQSNFFISDFPEDYLNMYANAQLIFTDRIHTSVVAKAYGRPYRFFGKTKRISVLERVEGKSLQKEKQEEIKFLKDALEEILK